MQHDLSAGWTDKQVCPPAQVLSICPDRTLRLVLAGSAEAVFLQADPRGQGHRDPRAGSRQSVWDVARPAPERGEVSGVGQDLCGESGPPSAS